MKLSDTQQKLRPIAYTVLRVVVGIIMLAHGWQKLAGYEGWQQNVASMGIPLPEVSAALAVAAELGGGILLILGLLTPLAALFVFGNLLVAIAYVHLGNGLFAKNNGWEYPLTIAVASLYFVFRGGGPLSVDSIVARLRARAKESSADERPGATPHRGGPAESAA